MTDKPVSTTGKETTTTGQVSIDSEDSSSVGPLPLVPQFILDRGFQLKEQIGRGHFANVYKAVWNEMPNKCIACKRIEIESVDQEWKEKCLKQEMVIMKKLKHPHIVKVYDLIKTRRLAFIFMEWAENGSVLSQLEKAKKPLKESQAKFWFRQLIGALYYMHTKGIAHRDIKLENFLLNSEWDALIADFGFACITYDKKKEKLLKSTNCGTNAYMAPEVHLSSDDTPYDAKASDLYSMGVSLFQMINYDKPFSEDLNPAKLIEYKLNRKYRFHSKLNSHFSENIKNLVNRLLEPKPQLRINAEQAMKHSALKV